MVLTTPVSDADLARLKLGDVVYLDGVVYTAREGVYRKVVDEGRGLPASVRALTNVNFHCSPAASVRPDGTLRGGGGDRHRLASGSASR